MANFSFKRKKDNYNPIYLHARREALIVITVWILGLAWTVGYCALTGYDIPPEQITTTLGMPDWVFWGILVPWVLVILFTIWFGLFYIADDEFLQEPDESEEGHFHNSTQPEVDEVS